jgi:hypothetical protein
MPAGVGPAGFAYFAAIKVAGYSAASIFLKNGYGLRNSPKPPVWCVGLTRTGIGLAAGAVYGALWIYGLSKLLPNTYPAFFYLFLLPVRLAEWSFLIWIFFDRGLLDRDRMWKYAGFGTLCSYGLDAIAVGAAVVLPGGLWIC